MERTAEDFGEQNEGQVPDSAPAPGGGEGNGPREPEVESPETAGAGSAEGSDE